jgi:hypothetical protein
MSFILVDSDSKNYHIYVHENYGNNCILISGRTQEGNDYIISNLPTILMNNFQIQIQGQGQGQGQGQIFNNVIWLHGHGPSPHFILYRSSSDIVLNPNVLEMFIKSKCPIKSNRDMPLTCSLLSNIVKTNVKGLVEVPNPNKLNKLLR